MNLGASLTLLAAATSAETASASLATIDLLTDLAVILCVAGATTIVFQKIRQPVVLGYLLAGLIVGPHLPIPLFANEAVAHELSEIGVILLMFSLGLEFSLRKLIRIGPTAGLVGVIQCSLMIWLGYVIGRLFGWTSLESLFAGAMIAISSTTIIIKAFAEQGIRGSAVELVFGVLIVEDLIAIVLLAVLTPLASGAALSPGALAVTAGKLAAFLVALLVGGILIVPRLIRFVVRMGRPETTVVASVGICFALALLARQLGYSVALGAFFAGALVSESGEGEGIERAIEPVRDVFAAIFFVSVGMLIDPQLVIEHWGATLVVTLAVVFGKVSSVTLGAFLAGQGVRTSVKAGMSLAQIGEFSFIIAGAGVASGSVRGFLYPVAVAVSAATTLLTPWLIRAAPRAASALDRRLPERIQTFVSLYASWVEQLGSTTRDRPPAWRNIRRLVGRLLIDVVAIAFVVIAASLMRAKLTVMARQHLELDAGAVRWLLVLGATLVSGPFIIGAVRLARALGAALAAEAIPTAGGGADAGNDAGEDVAGTKSPPTLDLGAAPRRALVVAFQLAILLVVGVPLAALTQPFAGAAPGLVILLLGLIFLAVPFWRGAADLHGHVRAGAQVLLEALARQTRDRATPDDSPQNSPNRSPDAPPDLPEHTLRDVKTLLPGLGAAEVFEIAEGSPAAGKTLAELDLRGQTGATVVAIDRGDHRVIYPDARAALSVGDRLVVTGSEEAVSAARAILAIDAIAPSK